MLTVSNPTIAWLVLFVAGAFEVVWALSMKASMGFTKFWPSATTLVALAVSMWLLTLSLKLLPVGTAYAVWTGIGAVGTALLGIILFNEPATAVRLACIALIVAGIAGLQITGAH
jgi:quaternary ammonium compound-resistance protein SugE